ncbi:PREDICTED: protein SMG7 isoform X3 [Rhinopithecus bieti]|uniref:protein SMG7 isoform X3 n=1 Tax=Rhinopithecus bieti TaxID=61621 RepID=UPI00083C4F48|nr:PREDICTED: protein SMG7 isoform X3 [Rhinopithecus bieti]
MEVKPTGNPGRFPGNPLAKGRVTLSAHTGYYDNTTTASSCHGSCLSNPIVFFSLSLRAPPYPLQESPSVHGEGLQRRGKGVLRVTLYAQGKTRVEGLLGGTVGGRGGVSGGEEWRRAKRKREIRCSDKKGEDFECNSRFFGPRCSWWGWDCPLAREEKGGLAGSRQAPPAGSSEAAHPPHSSLIPKGSATEKRKSPGGTGAAEISREGAPLVADFLPSSASSSFPRPLLSLPGSEVSLRPTGPEPQREAAFPRPSSPPPHSPHPPAERGGAGGEEDGGGRQHPRCRGAAPRSLRDPRRLRGKTRRRRMSLQSAQYLRQAEVLKADMTDSKLGPAEVWTSRQALQDLYQKMLVTDLEYALDKKVEQDLWNHAFKNQITTLQGQAKNRANPNRSEVQANLSLFLEAASGFYTQLLQELCTVFNVDLPCRVKSSQLGIISNKQTHTSAIVKPQSSSCSYICQHCLVHLGDIARYRNQTSQAESYYRHAAQLVPSNGQPYNQLAILASSKGDHLTTIFYYCRSIAVKFPFPAASTNLQKALSKALESRDEVKTKWGVSDFIKAFIKFHGHVYLSKSLEKLSPLREKLEEQFKRLLFQKAFNSQQLVHVTVINLFQLHHLRDFSNETEQHSYSQDEQLCWTQLLALFMSFLGILCKCPLQNESQEESYNAYPLPAVKVSMDWLRLRPRVFQEAVVDERQYIWPWLISLLNSFHPHEEDLSSTSATPLPEEFELQGFLALRPSFRNLDFSKGHQGITGDKEGQQRRLRQQRLITIGKWIADNQPRLIQCENEVGKLLFITEIPELILEDPSEAKENLILQETSVIESLAADGSPGLKSVLSTSRNLSNNCDTGEKPVVTFKENIKPREVNRDQGRSFPPKEVKSQTELRKTPVSEARKTPVTQTPTQASNSQFIPIHHPGAFPPLPSRPGFPPPTYVIPPPVAFSMGSGYTFPAGVSVPGTFLQPTAHSPAGNQVQAGKQSHIPYSQQRPSGPGPMNQGPQQSQPPSQQPLTSLPAQPTAQSTSQLQVQALTQQQQSPTKAVPALGKSPPHHSGFQQYQQADASKQLWNPPQVQGPLGKIMPVKQPYYLQTQDPIKLFEPSLQPPVMQQQPLEKKMKPFPMEPYNHNPSEVKVPEFYWDSSYSMADNRSVMAQQANIDRRGKRSPGVFRPEQDPVPRMPFEDPKSSPLLPPDLLKSLAALEEEEELIFSNPPDLYPALLGPLASLPGRSLFKSLLEKPSELMSHSSSFLSLTGFSLNQERYPNNSMFNEVYGKNLTSSSKAELNPSMAPQETSLYSLFEGTPWSPSLPASSDHSTPASQSPHSSNPSSLPSSPPTHNHNSVPFSNFGPIGTPDNRDRRTADRWKTDKPAMGGFGIDYLSATSSSESSWHQASTPSATWTGHGPSMEDSSAVLMESLKTTGHLTSADKIWTVFQSIWSSSMMHPGPSALEQLLMQQKQKQQRGQGTMNPPH